MLVVCAPDSFKETLSAPAAAEALAEGVRRARPGWRCDRCPVADGGEGSLDVLVAALGGTAEPLTVTGPLGEPVRAPLGILPGAAKAVVELAHASGFGLVPPDRRDPTRTTTFGTGQLIAAAVRRGCREVIVCVGGSATVDGGAGIAQALGGRFADRHGRVIEHPVTGGDLLEVATYTPPAGAPVLRVACDVTNPLLGPAGAAAVYGPQKGATPRQVEMLETALAHLASIAGGDPSAPGAGAAGGAGYGLAALLGATLHRGIDLVLETLEFRRRCAAAHLVLTGEGRLDDQTLHGKAAAGVARAAAEAGVPVIAIAGQVEISDRRSLDDLFAETVSLADRYGLDRALSEPAKLLAEVARELGMRYGDSQHD